MSSGGPTNPVHPAPTRRSGYRYLFFDKHHGGGTPDDSQWLRAVSREEFSIFDTADWHELSDERGWLFGVLRPVDGQIRYIGTWMQQLAAFPATGAGIPWHGYPLWPVSDPAPPNRRGEKFRPTNSVFQKMERAGLITAFERKRLFKGNEV